MSPDRFDEYYLDILLEPIRVCAKYKPQMGHGRRGGFGVEEFQKLYRSDAFYSWFGLDNPLMYAAHKAAGGMTSIYRQIGIGCERLFRAVLQQELRLSDADVKWSYALPMAGGRARTLSLDGRIVIDRVQDEAAQERLRDWLRKASEKLRIEPRVGESLSGAVFEVRQGYKSKDSKRQNADIANAATAYTQSYLPCVVLLSSQIDEDIKYRYTIERWLVLTGIACESSSVECTYVFMREVIGYDLAEFFIRNSDVLKSTVDEVLRHLLTPD